MSNLLLKDFISKSIHEINSGLPEGYALSEEIEFEVTVLTSSGIDNKVDLKVIQFGTDEKAEQAHKIKFSICNPAQQEKNMLSGAKQAQKLISSMMEGFVDSLKDIKKLKETNDTTVSSLQEKNS